jgi:hypothetical protein
MPDMAALLAVLGTLVRVAGGEMLGESAEGAGDRAVGDVRAQRARCEQAAIRQAHRALDAHTAQDGRSDGEWLSYTALLVQVDRIVDDLRAPLPP